METIGRFPQSRDQRQRWVEKAESNVSPKKQQRDQPHLDEVQKIAI